MHVDGFDGPVPAVLVMLHRRLGEGGWLEAEGIFRLAPNDTDAQECMAALNSGRFDPSAAPPLDGNVLAQCVSPPLRLPFNHPPLTPAPPRPRLFKWWFRDLQPSLYAGVPDDTMSRVASYHAGLDTDAADAAAGTALDALAPEYGAVARFLVAVLADVADAAETSKMSPRNVAVVFAPILWTTESENISYVREGVAAAATTHYTATTTATLPTTTTNELTSPLRYVMTMADTVVKFTTVLVAAECRRRRRRPLPEAEASGGADATGEAVPRASSLDSASSIEWCDRDTASSTGRSSLAPAPAA